jgi:hypothetical protein
VSRALASDIVAILTESGLPARRARAAFVAKLRDDLGLTFSQIAAQLHVTKQRAHQLYAMARYFAVTPMSEADEDDIYGLNFSDLVYGPTEGEPFFRTIYYILEDRGMLTHVKSFNAVDLTINIDDEMLNQWLDGDPWAIDVVQTAHAYGYSCVYSQGPPNPPSWQQYLKFVRF